jgi:hypothetical protein
MVVCLPRRRKNSLMFCSILEENLKGKIPDSEMQGALDVEHIMKTTCPIGKLPVTRQSKAESHGDKASGECSICLGKGEVDKQKKNRHNCRKNRDNSIFSQMVLVEKCKRLLIIHLQYFSRLKMINS